MHRALLLVLVVVSRPALAEEAVIRVAPGLGAVADYAPGPLRKPAILLVHGLLDGGAEPPLDALRQGLAEAGRAVLAPTLTLGVERRRQRLACEALHLHRLEQSAREISLWVDWMLARGHERLVLVTYGGGIFAALEYLSARPSAAVRSLLAVMPPDPDQPWGAETMDRLRRQAREALAEGDTGIGDYRFEACSRYRAPAAAFLSYARWSRAALLQQLQQMPIAVRVVSAEASRPDWDRALADTGLDVQRLPDSRSLREPDQIRTLVQLIDGMLRAAP